MANCFELTLVQNITENRLRHARGPVHLHWVCYMYSPVFRWFQYLGILYIFRTLAALICYFWLFLLTITTLFVLVLERLDFLMKFLDLPSKTRALQNMSGGQQRRASLAVALLHEPELLILDEPTVRYFFSFILLSYFIPFAYTVGIWKMN